MLLEAFGREAAMRIANSEKAAAFERIRGEEDCGWAHGLEIEFWADIEMVIDGEYPENLEMSIIGERD